MSSTDNRSRKILIPLATMAVAATVVVGSGATWTSRVEQRLGHVRQHAAQNAANGKTLTVDEPEAGRRPTGTLKITNTGTLPSQLKMTRPRARRRQRVLRDGRPASATCT